MIKSNNRFKITAVIVLGLIAVMTTLRIALIEDNIRDLTSDMTVPYEMNSTTTTVIFDIAVAVLAVAMLVCGILLGRKAKCCAEISTSVVVFTAALSGFMLLSTGIYYLYLNLIGTETNTGVIMDLLMIASSGLFLYDALAKTPRKSRVIPFLYLLPIAYAAYRLIREFIKQNSQPTTSASCYHLLGLVFLMLFLVNEGKETVGTGKMSLYVSFGYLAAFFLILSAIPTLMLSAFWLLPLGVYSILSACDFVLALYVLSRTYSIVGGENKIKSISA